MEQAKQASIDQQTRDLGTPTQIRQGANAMAQVLYWVHVKVIVPAQVVKPGEEALKAQLLQESQDVEAGLTSIAQSDDDTSFVSMLQAMCLPNRLKEEHDLSVVIGLEQPFLLKYPAGPLQAQANELILATGQTLASIPVRCTNFEQAIAAEQTRERNQHVAVAQRNAVLAQAAAMLLGGAMGASMGGVPGAAAGATMVLSSPASRSAGDHGYTVIGPNGPTFIEPLGNGYTVIGPNGPSFIEPNP